MDMREEMFCIECRAVSTVIPLYSFRSFYWNPQESLSLVTDPHVFDNRRWSSTFHIKFGRRCHFRVGWRIGFLSTLMDLHMLHYVAINLCICWYEIHHDQILCLIFRWSYVSHLMSCDITSFIWADDVRHFVPSTCLHLDFVMAQPGRC